MLLKCTFLQSFSYSSDSPKPPTKLVIVDLNSSNQELIDDLDVSFTDKSLNENGTWLHLTLSFLDRNKIKDINGRKLDHPDYDPRTLYVPEDFKVC